MSNASWADSLKAVLTTLRKHDQPPRVAIVGIGNEMCGDDAAGVVVARTLQRLLAHQTHVLVVEGGSAPENHTGALRRFLPDLVLLVDAAQIGEPPGMVRWLAWQDTSGLSASTHTMPPYVLAHYLTAELGCEVALIGVQPARMGIGEELSPKVRNTVGEIVRLLADVSFHTL